MNQYDTSGEASAPEPLPPFEHVSDALRAIPNSVKATDSDYLRYPHRHRALRGFLTLEALPLKPRKSSNTLGDCESQLVWQLFAIPGQQKTLRAPWLVAVWAWPGMDLVRVEKLGRLSAVSNQSLSTDCIMSGDYHAAFCKALRKEGP